MSQAHYALLLVDIAHPLNAIAAEKSRTRYVDILQFNLRLRQEQSPEKSFLSRIVRFILHCLLCVSMVLSVRPQRTIFHRIREIDRTSCHGVALTELEGEILRRHRIASGNDKSRNWKARNGQRAKKEKWQQNRVGGTRGEIKIEQDRGHRQAFLTVLAMSSWHGSEVECVQSLIMRPSKKKLHWKSRLGRLCARVFVGVLGCAM